MSKGAATIPFAGPESFTDNDELGILIDNFSRPRILISYNPPYYSRLVENAGFVKAHDAHSLYFDRDMADALKTKDRLARLVERVKKRSNITVRGVDRKNLKAEFGLFKELYNAAWTKNWGFVPMTPKELDNLVASLSQFFDPRLACFSYINNEPVGFMLTIPDFNQVLHRAYPRPGVPEVFTLAKALWYWKSGPVIDWVRVPLMGVKEEYRIAAPNW